jgi:hypothetical protein
MNDTWSTKYVCSPTSYEFITPLCNLQVCTVVSFWEILDTPVLATSWDRTMYQLIPPRRTLTEPSVGPGLLLNRHMVCWKKKRFQCLHYGLRCSPGSIFTKLRRRKHKRRAFVCFKTGKVTPEKRTLLDSTWEVEPIMTYLYYWWV